MTYSQLKPHILFNSNGLAMVWHSFRVVTHIDVKSGRKLNILNLNKLKFFMAYPHLKLHLLFNDNELSIRSGFPDITDFKKIMATIVHFGRHDLVSVRILPNFELNPAQGTVLKVADKLKASGDDNRH